MDFKLNLGAWNNIFAVPTNIIDKHLKTAGHKQLQILLYMLRNADKELSLDLLASEFNMHPIDVKDCLQFWETENVIKKSDNNFIPSEEKTVSPSQNINQGVSSTANESISNETSQVNSSLPKLTAKKSRSMSRPQKPDMIFVSSRIKNSEELQFLMQEAEMIFGKPLSNSDFSTLVMLHDDDGLPVSVIIMILQFAKSEGKASMRYIERLGIDWASDEIDTLEKAEFKISDIKRKRSNWETISKIFGVRNAGSPTKYQIECSTRWLDEWKYSKEMLRLAYEISIDSKGEYNLKYIDGIIKRWRKDSIQTRADYDSIMQNKISKQSTNSNTGTASFDLNAENHSDLFDI